MGPTNANPPIVVHHRLDRLGIVAGVVAGLAIGASMTLGGLLLAGRVDLDAPHVARAAAAPETATLLATHVQREYRFDADAMTATVIDPPAAGQTSSTYLDHLRREYRSDMSAATEPAIWTHIRREYRLAFEDPASVTRRHLMREHQADVTSR